MINEANYITAKYIESGHYFRDSVDWYITKYLYCYTFRTYLFLVFCMIGFCLFPLYFQYQQVADIKHYPFPIYSIDEVRYFPVIKPLSLEKEPINVSIARYVVGYYVELREGYRYENQFGENKDIVYNKVAALSSHKVFRNYNNYMDPDYNPDSPLILYKNNIARIIKIKSIELLGNPIKPDSAKVTYSAIERSNYGDRDSEWRAELDFNMSNIENIHSKQTGLSFTVTRYRTYKL